MRKTRGVRLLVVFAVLAAGTAAAEPHLSSVKTPCARTTLVFGPTKVVHRTATFRLKGIDPGSVRSARLAGVRNRRLPVRRVRAAARRGVLRVPISSRAKRLQLRVVVCGNRIPSGDQPGWRLVFRDGFSSNSLSDKTWGKYHGQPAGDPGGWWEPSHVVVRKGILRLESYRDPKFGNRWVSGGVSSSRRLKQTYGKYEVRFRMDAGTGVHGVALLWPSDDVWPPEIDFWEASGELTRDRRDLAGAFLHYGADNHQIQSLVKADFTRWHTAGLEWAPGRLDYTLDGRVWATLSNPNVPNRPMELDIQTQAGTCGDSWAPCPDATTPAKVDMEVDWVAAWAYARSGG